ncbi:uncharacterized protein LOC124149818 [Haliotis rufescens]|uniref:uncharacterized protein LOC124149818 n=1 Tax=Haliotis rufescens TaxID=6454 RepID=UPI00201E9203|nr:uncharacterized protein LOC124149818 [Haliotis rufescens]
MWKIAAFSLVLAVSVKSNVGDCASICADFTRLPQVKMNTNLVKSPHRHTSATFLKCVKICLGWSLCKSFDYVMAEQRCTLNEKDETDLKSTSLEFEEGTIYSSISLWERRFSGVCDGHVCADNDYCYVTRDGTADCAHFP